MALWCFEGFSCRITSWLHFCLELWRDWNIYITLTYPTPVWWLLMNTFLTVWKASGPLTWHGISWKPFHLELFKISAVWTNLTCRATNWEHFQKVFFGIWVVWQNSTCKGTCWAHWTELSMALWCLEGFTCRTTSWLHYRLELWRDWNI